MTASNLEALQEILDSPNHMGQLSALRTVREGGDLINVLHELQLEHGLNEQGRSSARRVALTMAIEEIRRLRRENAAWKREAVANGTGD